MWAAACDHTEVVRALLATPGIDLSKRATDGAYKGKTALGLAIARVMPEAAALLRAAEAAEVELRLAPAPALPLLLPWHWALLAALLAAAGWSLRQMQDRR